MTPNSYLVEGHIAALREHEIRLLDEIARALPTEGDQAESDRQRLRDIARDLRDMFFMVAVIGEFNSGKSSFVNALIGEKLLPMGITPTTEHIELIRYSESVNRVPVIRDDGVREWAHPNIGTAGVAIVDTPGTGSVFQRHEKTAKSFLHRSDLVVFIISAKQAFAESERLYLQLAKDYGKKILLVVNQVDLLSASEQNDVRRFIEEQVKETLGLEPLIFMVSARDSLNSSDGQGGGMGAVRAHLRGTYSDAPPAKQKLLAQLETAHRILNSYSELVHKRLDLVNHDVTKLGDLETELEKQSFGLAAQMAEARAEITESLEGIRQRGMSFIDANLSLRQLGRGTNREQLQNQFQEIVIGRAWRDVEESTERYINAVVDQSRNYWRNVIERLNQLRDLLNQEVSSPDSAVYAQQRESLQDAIRIAEAELKRYSTGSVVGEMEGVFQSNVVNFQRTAIAALGGLVLVAAAIAAPGGIVSAAAPLAAPAFVVGAAIAAVFGLPAINYLRRVVRDTKADFNAKVDTLVKNYNSALEDLTTRERARLVQYGKQILSPVFGRLEALRKKYQEQDEQLTGLHKGIKDLQEKIQKA